VVSLATVTLPKNWDPEKTYPVFVHLHGLSSNYELPIDILTNFYLKGASTTYAYEDGYWLAPWGRGNLWYFGIAETDVWESLAELKRLVKIDLKRQYITGHSMGGYGSWYIASRSARTWAALGVEAGAIQYNYETLLKDEVVQQLKDLPTYFVVGVNDNLIDGDRKAYNLLKAAGNNNTKFVTFNGAHEHLFSNDENLYLWMKKFVNDNYSSIAKSVTYNTNELKCYPNPFKNETVISYSIPENSASLFIFNITGQVIKKYDRLRGLGSVQFDGSELTEGVYVYKLVKSNKTEITNKMVILR
jgi:pimeloyl-ACP methyl ester carboxylesterase